MGAKISNICNLSLRNRPKWPPPPTLTLNKDPEKFCLQEWLDACRCKLILQACLSSICVGTCSAQAASKAGAFPSPLFPSSPSFLLPPFPSQCFPPSPSPAAHKSLSLWLAHPHQQQESSQNQFEFNFCYRCFLRLNFHPVNNLFSVTICTNTHVFDQM